LKALLFANTDWYLFNFRLPLAHALREAGVEVVLLSPDGRYGEKLRAAGFRWHALDMQRRSLNPFRELGLLAQIARFYRRENPDIVHHFTLKSVIYGSLAARAAGIPRCVNAVTGMGYVFANNAPRARLLRPFLSGLLRMALRGDRHRLILQNGDDLNAFTQAGLIASDRIRLIPGSGVNTGVFKPAYPPDPHQPILRVLFAARLLWDKGLSEFIDAAGKLHQLGLPIEFLIAGDPDPGNPASVPESVVQAWRNDGVVQVLGHVEDMAACLRGVDVAVLPSYREGVPKSLIEAAASGLPIITTDAPGCRDVVEHGVTGLLVSCRDSVALADAIHFMLRNADLRLKMGVAGREKILREFDERIVLSKTLQVYRELGVDLSA
jgi:glycosyltransferase involved in cell wall biosynthesis